MKKNLLTGAAIAFGLALTVSSCGDDSSSIGAGMGRISPDVELDSNVIKASTSSRAGEDDDLPSVSELKLKLTSEDGTYSKVWDSVDEFDSTQDFKTGNYTLEAWYGSADDAEGKAKPYFYGKQMLEVKYDRTTTVNLSARMENSRIRIAYTDAFRDYMTSYAVQLHTPAGNYLDVASDETEPVYVTTGTVNVNLTFTKPNGTTATIEAARFTAKPKTEHVVTLDINGGDAGADAGLKVSFDDTIDEADVEIDLSDEILNAPAPEIIVEGFTSGQTFDIVEGADAPAPVKTTVIARGKISSVMLSTDSRSLIEDGWPATIDLATADDATVARLQGLGLNARGIWKNPDIMGVIDFTNVFRNLRVSLGHQETTHHFSLQVKDGYGKLSETVDFAVVTSTGAVEIKSASVDFGSTSIIANVDYNGGSLATDVTFQILNDLGAWGNIEIADIKAASRVSDMTSYIVTLTAPNPIVKPLNLRAVFGSIKSESKVELIIPEFSVAAPAGDVYAKSAIVTFDCQGGDASVIARAITSVTVDNQAVPFTLDGNVFTVSGLTPSATNKIVFTSVIGTSADVSVETEAVETLPNADMETWYRVAGRTNNWWIDYPGADENAVWGTLNLLTTSEGGSTTSAFSSNRDGCSYNAYSCVRPAQPGHNGSNNAAIISTVGWGKGNSATGSVTSSTCKHITVGELYLGKYENGAPNYSGHAISSRPASLTFYYKYSPKNSADYGYAEVKVKDAAGNEIASNNIQLHSAADFTLATVSLNYERGAAKAANISVVFKSSGNPGCQSINSTNLSAPSFGNTSNGRFTGSELTVDDITLNY